MYENILAQKYNRAKRQGKKSTLPINNTAINESNGQGDMPPSCYTSGKLLSVGRRFMHRLHVFMQASPLL